MQAGGAVGEAVVHVWQVDLTLVLLTLYRPPRKSPALGLVMQGLLSVGLVLWSFITVAGKSLTAARFRTSQRRTVCCAHRPLPYTPRWGERRSAIMGPCTSWQVG